MSSRPKILLVTDQIPGNMGMGGTQRTTHLYRALSNVADTDTFLLANPAVFHPTKSGWHREQFRVVDAFNLPKRGEYFPWRLIRSIWPGGIDKLATQIGDPAVPFTLFPPTAQAVARCIAAGKYDLIVSRYMMPTVAAGLLGHPGLLVDLDDLDTVAAQTRAEAPELGPVRKILMQRKASVIEKIVPPLWGKWSLAWACCDEDANIISSACERMGREPRVALLPNIPQAPASEPPPAPGNKVIISVASLKYHPNQAGIDWFIRRVWPSVRKEHPTATYRIAGGGLPEKIKSAWASVEGVVVVGFAQDLAAEYAACDFAVAAVFEGSGTKIKVLEALAFNRSCALVSHALRGYEKTLRHEQEIMLADDPAAMAAVCNDLLSHPQKAATLAAAGRAVVEREYSFERFSHIVGQSVESTLETMRARSAAVVSPAA
jgi:polysaccharide biosynthesis protein PslH